MNEWKLIVCCTQNDAIQLLRRLQSCGIRGNVTRPPRNQSKRSCSWAVQIAERDSKRAEDCLRKGSIHWEWME
ncbi:MAG: DUF3343 domain-containing protein [Eubacteriales bacterium]|nr:DUF3343 domain-containing protein [Eubacteriales bacterium]